METAKEIERPIRKILEHLDDALIHLQNVQSLNHDQATVIGCYLAHVSQMLRDEFKEAL